MNNDETLTSLLPEGLRPLYGKGLDQDQAQAFKDCSDLVSYVHRLVVRAGRFPPITLAFEAFASDGVPLAFVVGDEITVHGVPVKVADYETDVDEGFGTRGPVNLWTVYVDEVDGV